MCVCTCAYVFVCVNRGMGGNDGEWWVCRGDNAHGLANSRRGKFREWTGCGHREEVVESTISLPLHTVGTWWALTDAGKTHKTSDWSI